MLLCVKMLCVKNRLASLQKQGFFVCCGQICKQVIWTVRSIVVLAKDFSLQMQPNPIYFTHL